MSGPPQQHTECISSIMLSPTIPISCVNDLNMLRDVRRVKREHIPGSDLFADWEGTADYFGPALYVPKAQANILSLGIVLRYGSVTFESDSDGRTSIHVSFGDSSFAVFSFLSGGQYVCNFDTYGPRSSRRLQLPKGNILV